MNAIRNFVVYGLAGTASRLVMVFLVPLYTRALSIGQYGQLEFLLAAAGLLTILAGLQSETAVLREYHVAKREKRLPELRWAAFVIAAGGSLLLGIVAGLSWLAGLLPDDFAALLPMVLAIAVATQVLGIQLVLLRFDDRPVFFGFVTFADVLVAATLSFVLLVQFDWGVAGALTGVLCGKIIGIGAAWARTFVEIPADWPSAALVRRMLAFSVPTTAPVFLNWVQNNGARIVLAAFFTLTDVAIASIGIRVAALFGFLVYAFRLAWEPWAFRMLDDPDRPASAYGDVLKCYVVAMVLAASVAIALSPVLVAIFAPTEYAAAVVLCGGFVMGQLWLGIGNLASIGIHGSRKTGKLVTVALMAAAVNLALLAALAPALGVVGAMIAFLASAMTRGFAASVMSNTLFATAFSLRLLILAGVASLGLAGAAYALFDGNAGQPLVTQAGAMATMLALGLIAVALLVFTAIPAAERRAALREGSERWRLAWRAFRSKE
ncbi:MAG: lipopolysaccharide biosynthesis protein [Erythrobacter sp.]